MGAVFEAVRRKYPRLAKDFLRPLLQLLTDARAACGGDQDMALILLVLAIRAAEHPDFALLPYEQVENGGVAEVPSLPINVRSLAESTGMAKETVRRKVQQLTRLGLVTRNGRSLAYTPAALLVLSPIRNTILRQAIANHTAVDPIIQEVHRDATRNQLSFARPVQDISS